MEQASDEVCAATWAAYAMLRDAADGNSHLKLPASFAEVHAQHWRIMAVDAAVYHRESFTATPQAFGPHIAKLIQADWTLWP